MLLINSGIANSGIKKRFFELFSHELLNNKSLVISLHYNSDQIFIGDFIYHKVVSNTLIHTSFFAFFNERYIRINKSIESNNFIGSIYTERQNKTDVILHYNFMVGIPFWVAKFLRYKVRPVLYLSYLFNLIFKSK